MPTNQDRESCSICGAAIEGVATVAPGVHELRPCGHPASHEHRTKAAEPLVPDGGTARPAFIGPQTEWVECYHCGRIITDFSRVEGLDISSDDEYYPRMVPVCRDGNHRDPHREANRGALRPDGGEDRRTDIVDAAPEGYPRCGGCGHVFEHDDELTSHECDLLDLYRATPMQFPLHVLDEHGEPLCGSLSEKAERFLDREGYQGQPTIRESRGGEPWVTYIDSLCGNCTRILASRLGAGHELAEALTERRGLVADGGRVLSHADVRGRSEAAQRSVRARLEQIRDDIDGLLESGDVGSIEGVVFGVADADLAEARATQRPGCEPPAPLLRILGEFVDGMAQTSGREPGFIAGYAVKMMEHSKASDDYNQTANTSRGDGE